MNGHYARHQIEEAYITAKRARSQRAPASALAEYRDEALAPGTVYMTGDGKYRGLLAGRTGPRFDTYKEAEAWVIRRKFATRSRRDLTSAEIKADITAQADPIAAKEARYQKYLKG